MSENTMQALIEQVEMSPVDAPSDPIYPDLPYVTHEGVLKLGPIELRVLQLSSGQRVISGEDIEKLLGLK